jgi:hypothetical protein
MIKIEEERKLMVTQSQRNKTSRIIIPICAGLSVFSFGPKLLSQTIHDAISVDRKQAESCLRLAQSPSAQHPRSAADFLKIYGVEEAIGAFAIGIPPGTPDTIAAKMGYFHTELRSRCAKYVGEDLNRFQEVDDGWKGESNYWEPNRYWLDEIIRLYPDSYERKEIEWDFEYKAFIRQFSFDEEARGKTCEEYYHDPERRKAYQKVYSEKEIDEAIPSCRELRAKFESGRAALLKKYGNLPFTKKLRDIDVTTVILFLSTC